MQGLRYTEPTPVDTTQQQPTMASNQQPQQQPLHRQGKLPVTLPSNFEIFNACVNDLTGKDKLAKIVLYSIRLLTSIHDVHGLGNPSIARSIKSAKIIEENLNKHSNIILNDESTKNINKSSTYPSNGIINLTSFTYLLPLFSKFLLKASNILSKSKLHRCLLLFLAFLVNKLSDLMNGLSIYRHLLRAGTIPFRVWRFTNHIRYSLNILLDRSKLDGPAVRIEKVLKYWTSKDMISQIANAWYTISDEILLIFRFKLLLEGNKGGSNFSNSLFVWAEDHELYSWMATILLGLNNDWEKWILLKDEESKIILNQKVRARTKRIVGDFKRKNKVSQSSPEIDTEDEYESSSLYLDKLVQTNKDIKTVQINSIRLFCDLIFDAKYIFHWDMYKPLHVTIGMMSGCLGMYNVWRQQKERLTREAIADAEAKFQAEINNSDNKV
ncbi:hypothetical protein C6P42_002840 [Pichia californica]|nr:hypothetical protein C6P42_002840 [[Candida] californica]